MSTNHLSDGVAQGRTVVGFEDNPFDPGMECLQQAVVVGAARQQDGTGTGRRLLDLEGSVEAVEQRHHEVEDRHIRLQLPRQTHGLMAVRGFPDDLEALALQEELHRLTNDGVIVGKENPNCHRAVHFQC